MFVWRLLHAVALRLHRSARDDGYLLNTSRPALAGCSVEQKGSRRVFNSPHGTTFSTLAKVQRWHRQQMAGIPARADGDVRRAGYCRSSGARDLPEGTSPLIVPRRRISSAAPLVSYSTPLALDFGCGSKRVPRELRNLALPDREWNVAPVTTAVPFASSGIRNRDSTDVREHPLMQPRAMEDGGPQNESDENDCQLQQTSMADPGNGRTSLTGNQEQSGGASHVIDTSIDNSATPPVSDGEARCPPPQLTADHGGSAQHKRNMQQRVSAARTWSDSHLEKHSASTAQIQNRKLDGAETSVRDPDADEEVEQDEVLRLTSLRILTTMTMQKLRE